MSDAILVLNAGSSSLKFSIYDAANHTLGLKARGQMEGLGAAPRFTVKDQQGRILANSVINGVPEGYGHPEALTHLAGWMREYYGGFLSILAVGHRVVHGGSDFIAPTLIDAEVMKKLEELIPLVPLHQPHNLAGVRAAMRMQADLPQVACFDTAFHEGRPPVTERFGLPDEFFRNGVRRWGFHGLSYESVMDQFRRKVPHLYAGRVIAAHLGSGASMCAMKNGRSVDTTMGFSALDGLPMGTRCGNLDPGVILFLLRQGWSPNQIEELLYRQSGLLGISRISNDVRDLLANAHPLAAEALEYFVYRIVREIGALTAVLGGLDALIFTAGIGENSPTIRQRVGAGLDWLGLEIDSAANQQGLECISPPGRVPSVWVIPTDEERVIAAQTLAVIRSPTRGMRSTTTSEAPLPKQD